MRMDALATGQIVLNENGVVMTWTMGFPRPTGMHWRLLTRLTDSGIRTMQSRSHDPNLGSMSLSQVVGIRPTRALTSNTSCQT